MANKITKREVINSMLASEVVSANEMWVEYLKHELELMDNKKASKKQTETQKANEGIKEQVVSALGELGKAVTISELQAYDSELGQYSTSKLSALMRQLIEADLVVKTADKKRSVFSLKGEAQSSPQEGRLNEQRRNHSAIHGKTQYQRGRSHPVVGR